MGGVSGIVGDWIHAHEQDSGSTRVFVPAGQKLPPSRGRRRISLRAGGSFSDTRAGPDDKAKGSAGTYQFDGHRLTLRYEQAGQPPLAYQAVLSADGTRLELVREGP